MIMDQELLTQFHSIYHSLDSLRSAILSLSKQNLQLLRLEADIHGRQLELECRTAPRGMDLDGLPLYLASFFVSNKGKDGP